MILHLSFFFFTLSCFVPENVSGFGYDYTMLVPAGSKECYYQPISAPYVVEFEYQVLDQSPVNFQIRSPNNVYIAADIRKALNTYTLHLKDIGIYEVCVLNRYTNNPVTVYMGIYCDMPDKTWPFTNNEHIEKQVEEAEVIMEVSSTEILKSIDTMQLAAEKMRFLQQSIRTSNVKDFIVQRSNYSRVNFFSGAQLLVMVVAGIVQVVTIRQLFGDQSAKAHNMKLTT